MCKSYEGKYFKHISFLTVFILFFAACSDWPPDPKMLHADYDQYTPGFPESDRMPRIASDGTGNWIVIWQGNSRAKQTGGANCPLGGVKDDVIYTIRSTDNGKIWSLPKCEDTGDQNGSPALATDGKGNWVAVWQTNGSMLGTDSDIFVSMSTDKSWGQPAPSHPWDLAQALNSNANNDQGDDLMPKVIWDGKSKWVAVWTSNESLGTPGVGQDYDIFYTTSTDGKTWSAPKVLNSNAATDTGKDTNPNIACDNNGNLVVVWQSDDPLGNQNIGTDTDILLSRSNDGISWSPVEPLNTNAVSDKGNDSNPCIAFGNGRWNAAWVSDENLSNAVGTDLDIFVSYGTGTGQNWLAPKIVNQYMANDKSIDLAPNIAYGNGEWFIVWYSNEDVGSPPNSAGIDYDILMTQSYDDGTSWNFNSVIHSSGYGDTAEDKSPHIATDGKDNWIVVWSSDYPGKSGSNWGLDFDILAVQF